MNLQEWGELIHSLPCCVCFLQTGDRKYGVHAHHIESVRDELSDWLVVPLCPDHHQGPNGIHGLSRSAFYTRYNMTELTLIKGTLKLAAQMLVHPGHITILEAIATRDRA